MHGGWATRQSLVHYDLMKKGEESAVSRALNLAVRGFVTPTGQAPEEGLDRNPDVAPVAPTEHKGEVSSEEEEEGKYLIRSLLDIHDPKEDRRFKCLWEPCAENEFGVEITWEREKTLLADGLKGKIDYFLKSQKKKRKTRNKKVHAHEQVNERERASEKSK